MYKPIRQAKGFTLIELMVAILVLAIGLLGLAGLQVIGLRSGHNAYLRTQATLLAQDMADRMRNNRENLASYLGTETADKCDASLCSGAQMAGYDLAKWHEAIINQLPGGSGVITNDPGGSLVYKINITWNEFEENQDAVKGIVQRQFEMSFQP